MMDGHHWRKASYSGNQGNCVEVAPAADVQAIGVRDTKDRRGGQLTVPAGGWTAFVAAVKNGDAAR